MEKKREMSDFLLIIAPNGDKILRNTDDIKHIRLTKTETGVLSVYARIHGDTGEKTLCTGPDSLDYFDWLCEKLTVLDIWKDKGVDDEEA